VLAGDSPLDWAKITKPGQLRAVPPRGPFVASLVQQQVLARGRRALLCYGMTGLFHCTGMTGAIERQAGQRIYVIADLVPLAGDPGGLAQRLSRYPRDTVIPAAGTWLGSFNAGPVCGRSPPRGKNPFCGVRLGSLIDAGLYPGQPGVLTATWPDPDIYFSPGRHLLLPPVLGRTTAPQRPHRQRRRPGQLRQQRPPRYPLTPLPPPRRCAQNQQAGT
jgi:hypothetical protein